MSVVIGYALLVMLLGGAGGFAVHTTAKAIEKHQGNPRLKGARPRMPRTANQGAAMIHNGASTTRRDFRTISNAARKMNWRGIPAKAKSKTAAGASRTKSRVKSLGAEWAPGTTLGSARERIRNAAQRTGVPGRGGKAAVPHDVFTPADPLPPAPSSPPVLTIVPAVPSPSPNGRTTVMDKQEREARGPFADIPLSPNATVTRPYGGGTIRHPDAPPGGTAMPSSTAGTGATEDLFTAFQTLTAQALQGGIHDKARAIKAIAEAQDFMAEVTSAFARSLAEPDQHYPPSVWEPLAQNASHLKAGAMKAGESETSLQALLSMPVGELAASSVQAPHHDELNKGA